MNKKIPKIIAVSELIEAKTGLSSGLYTSTNYDEYINIKTKVHYVRGLAVLYSDCSTNSSIYKPLDKIPMTIENTQLDDWKLIRNTVLKKRGSMDLVTAYVSRRLMGD